MSQVTVNETENGHKTTTRRAKINQNERRPSTAHHVVNPPKKEKKSERLFSYSLWRPCSLSQRQPLTILFHLHTVGSLIEMATLICSSLPIYIPIDLDRSRWKERENDDCITKQNGCTHWLQRKKSITLCVVAILIYVYCLYGLHRLICIGLTHMLLTSSFIILFVIFLQLVCVWKRSDYDMLVSSCQCWVVVLLTPVVSSSVAAAAAGVLQSGVRTSRRRRR